MRVEPLTPDAVVDRLVGEVLARGTGRLRVVVDGPGPTRPGVLADRLGDPLRAAGRPVVRVHARDFLRPASVRLEHGREDPDALLDDWLDSAALIREVLDPLEEGATGRYLPSLWDAERDRATRAAYEHAPPGTVLLLDGSLLLGRWLPVDLTVHLDVRPASLARMAGPDEQWTLPAYARYAREVDPAAVADVVVKVDDPRRPALVTRP